MVGVQSEAGLYARAEAVKELVRVWTDTQASTVPSSKKIIEEVSFYLNGKDAQAICSYLVDALQLLEHMRQQNAFAFSVSTKGNEAQMGVEMENKRLKDQSVKQLFEVHWYHLTTSEEYKVDFLADVVMAKMKGDKDDHRSKLEGQN